MIMLLTQGPELNLSALKRWVERTHGRKSHPHLKPNQTKRFCGQTASCESVCLQISVFVLLLGETHGDSPLCSLLADVCFWFVSGGRGALPPTPSSFKLTTPSQNQSKTKPNHTPAPLPRPAFNKPKLSRFMGRPGSPPNPAFNPSKAQPTQTPNSSCQDMMRANSSPPYAGALFDQIPEMFTRASCQNQPKATRNSCYTISKP